MKNIVLNSNHTVKSLSEVRIAKFSDYTEYDENFNGFDPEDWMSIGMFFNDIQAQSILDYYK